MSNNIPNLKELKAIAEWVNLSGDIREISLKVGDIELFMSRNNGSARAAAAPVATGTPAPAPTQEAAPPVQEPSPSVEETAPAVAPAATAESTGSAEGDLAPGEVVVEAPMVGTFYAAPRPGAPAFVSPGDVVQKGSILGIVEVMKLMNNLEAKVSGTVSRILVENGQAVEYGQALMVIRSDD